MIRRILFSLALFISASFVGPVSVTLAGPVAIPALKPNAPFSPATQTNNSYWYSLAGSASDSTYILNSSALKLLADRSGNSAVNGLVLNSTASNSASSPNAAVLQIVGDLDIDCNLAPPTWTPSALVALVSKAIGGTSGEYQFRLLTDGTLALLWYTSGVIRGVYASTVAISSPAFSELYVRATRTLNGAQNDIKFFTSPDGTTWTQLGTTVAGSNSAPTASTNAIYVGMQSDGISSGLAGFIKSVRVYSGIRGAGGTLVWNPVFSAQAKLATSFTESSSNAATVTINTSGDFGARISGARDLVQLTASHQPAFGTSAGYNQLTTDGTNDVMRSAPFAEAQPITDYTVASMVTWTSGAYLWDGASGANTAAAIMTTSTPQVNISAGSSVAANTNAVVGTLAVFTEFLSGASSSLQVNATTATTGNAGTGTPNGVTIGASGASTPANFSNIVIREKLGRTATDSSTLRTQFYTYLKAKNGVP